MRPLSEVLFCNLPKLGNCILNWDFHKPVVGLKQWRLKKAISRMELSFDQELIITTPLR